MMDGRLFLATPIGLALLTCGACDRVSFSFHDRRPVHEVRVVETYPTPDVHVVETYPAREVHVVETPPAREVVIVETPPIRTVHIDYNRHVCTARCAHYYNGSAFIALGAGHHHGPNCGHYFNGRHWVIRKSNAHKARRHGPVERKFKRRH